MSKEQYTNAELLEEVEVEQGLLVPRAFALHWKEIQKPKTSFIKVTTAPFKGPHFGQSSFGAFPLLPIDFPYPMDSSGNPLFPLAQINCKDLPALAGYPHFGHLQFYISGSDDLYGLNLDDQLSQADSRILYFEDNEVMHHQTEFTFLKFSVEDYILPMYNPHLLNFALKEEFPGGSDIHYEAFQDKFLLPIAGKYPEIKEDLLFEISYCLENRGHKIGGFAHFTQSDPRGLTGISEQLKEYILLMQIWGDEDIMWGDGGVGNFFIHPDALRKKDFSRVMFNWDCG
jgi:uncharacterized protein YwqG